MIINPISQYSLYNAQYGFTRRETAKAEKATAVDERFSSSATGKPADFSGGNNNRTGELPSFYYQPLSFGRKKQSRTYSSSKRGLKEVPSQFKITKFNDVPCPACGTKMLTRINFDRIKQRLNDAQPDRYIEIVGEYRDYMRPVERSAYDDIKAVSDKTGEKDIRKVVEMLRDTKLKELQQVQTALGKKIFELAGTLPDNEREALMDKAKELMRLIKKNRPETPFRRKVMIDKISQIEITDQQKQKELLSIAKSFPTSKDMNSAWIVKYSGLNREHQPWDSKDIAIRLLEFSVPNTDHIIAYSIERNNDDVTNYLAMHSGCNTHKSDKTFMEWFNEDPEGIRQHLTDYFDSVDTIISEKLKRKRKYRNYVAYATETIKQVSNGQVDLTPKSPEDKE